MKSKPTVILGKKKYTFEFTMEAWRQLEETVDTLENVVHGLQQKGRLALLPQVVGILARDEDGAAPAPGDIAAAMTPPDVRTLMAAINQAINLGMKMEVRQAEEGAVVDETLEELEKNAAQDG
ncbi:MAG: hypothetical protein K5919_05240 [Clostridiales bacterium]|nr:hypothetical protein [Clostridiales bacterium]